MFNRQPFNRGRFNRGLSKSVFFDGIATAETNLHAEACLTAARPFTGEAVIELSASGNITAFIGLVGSVNIELTASGIMAVPRIIEGSAHITMTAENSGIIRGRVLDPSEVAIFAGAELSENINVVTAIWGDANIGLETEGRLNAVLLYSGGADILLNSAVDKINIAKSIQGSADILLTAAGRIAAAIPFQGDAAILLSSAGRLNRVFGLQGRANILLVVENEGFNIFRYEHIHLPTLSIPVGGELIIDTDDMTITLNGQNVMRHLSRDSEFFLLNPATNEIVYTSGNQNNRANINILWKDAWL